MSLRSKLASLTSNGVTITNLSTAPNLDFRQPNLPVRLTIAGGDKDVTIPWIRVEVIRGVRTARPGYRPVAWDFVTPTSGVSGKEISGGGSAFSQILFHSACTADYSVPDGWLLRAGTEERPTFDLPLTPVNQHAPMLKELGNPDLLVEDLPRSLRSGGLALHKDIKFFVKATLGLGFALARPMIYEELTPVNFEGLFSTY